MFYSFFQLGQFFFAVLSLCYGWCVFLILWSHSVSYFSIFSTFYVLFSLTFISVHDLSACAIYRECSLLCQLNSWGAFSFVNWRFFKSSQIIVLLSFTVYSWSAQFFLVYTFSFWFFLIVLSKNYSTMDCIHLAFVLICSSQYYILLGFLPHLICDSDPFDFVLFRLAYIFTFPHSFFFPHLVRSKYIWVKSMSVA